MFFVLFLRSSAAHAYVDPAMRWRAAETMNFFAFLRLEDPGRPSEAGWRKTFQPASLQVEAPGWDEPMAVNEREATCGTSCKDLGGIVPPEAKLKMWT